MTYKTIESEADNLDWDGCRVVVTAYICITIWWQELTHLSELHFISSSKYEIRISQIWWYSCNWVYFLKQDNFFEYYNTSAMVPDDVENKSVLDIRNGNSSNEQLRYILTIFAIMATPRIRMEQNVSVVYVFVISIKTYSLG